MLSATPDYRTAPQRDIDKIVFSHHFRLLAVKSQVHSPRLGGSTRTRLTHSLEVSRIAASLCQHVVSAIGAEYFPTGHQPREQQILTDAATAASLLHDIGTPPLAHVAEKQVRRFFAHNDIGRALLARSHEETHDDFLCWNANMQTMRIALFSGWRNTMNLTPLTIAAYTKYPALAVPGGPTAGVYRTCLTRWLDSAKQTGLDDSDPSQWRRHALAYITETADDIAYLIADIEDAALLDIIDLQDALEIHSRLLPQSEIDRARDEMPETSRLLPWLRSQSITRLISIVASSAAMPETARLILSGRLSPANLLANSPVAATIEAIRTWSRTNIYAQRRLSSPSDDGPSLGATIDRALEKLGRLTLGETDADRTLARRAAEYASEPNRAHAFIDLLTDLSDRELLDAGADTTP